MPNYLNLYVALDILRGSRIILQIGKNTTVPQLGGPVWSQALTDECQITHGVQYEVHKPKF